METLDPEDDTTIFTYTMINCSEYDDAYIEPYFCFNSLCSECVITSDFQDDCQVIV